jgi:uncharacterized membrane protein SpoIIM required for sporulation
MTESDFVARRSSAWRAVEDALLERKGPASLRSAAAAESFPRLYRRLCRDLNCARAWHFSLELQERLNRLVVDAHLELYRVRRPDPIAAILRSAAECPRAVRRMRALTAACAALFVGAAILAFAWASGDRERAASLLGAGTVAQLEEMYDPNSELFMKPRDVKNDADMFGYYISHNIGIGLGTMAGGLLAGAGSILALAFNGAFLGAAAAAILGAGYSGTFFPFVCGHSAFEMTALVLFAAAGFRMGCALMAPGRRSRAAALREAGQEALPVAALAFVFMAIAATVESFWSARPMLPTVKYAVAAVLWACSLGYLFFGGSRRDR